MSYEEHLREELTRIIFDVMEKVPRLSVTLCPETLSVSDPVVACIETTGERRGGLMVTFDRSLANRLASGMFELGEGTSASDDERDDCLREITNMVGGNLKSVLPFDGSLTVPRLGTLPDELTAGRGIKVCITYEGCAAEFYLTGNLFR
jgi:hypothetical protein